MHDWKINNSESLLDFITCVLNQGYICLPSFSLIINLLLIKYWIVMRFFLVIGSNYLCLILIQ
jgi:hypothetical protein